MKRWLFMKVATHKVPRQSAPKGFEKNLASEFLRFTGRPLRPISTSIAIRKSHAILCLKFACERSQIACERSQCDFDLFAMFDFLRTFACESLSRIEASQLENNITKQRDKGATRYQKETDFHWLNKQSKFMRIRLKCVLNSQAFGMQNSQIAFVLRIAIEVKMGLYKKFSIAFQ